LHSYLDVNLDFTVTLAVYRCEESITSQSKFLLAIVFSVLLRFTDSDCPFGILDLQILIAPLVSSNLSSI